MLTLKMKGNDSKKHFILGSCSYLLKKNRPTRESRPEE